MAFKLHAVRVFSVRWKTSFHFYAELLGLPLVFTDETLGWAEFDLGGPHLGLERCAPEEPETKTLVGRFVGISIAVEDIARVYEDLISRPANWRSELHHGSTPP